MIHIFTSVVNRPDFLELQSKLFSRFLSDEYHFHVIDDSIDDNLSNQFKSISEANGMIYYKKRKRTIIMNPAQSCADAIQWAFDTIIKQKYRNDIVFFCDSDMFLVDNFNITEYISDSVISGLPQTRGHINYMWNGIMFFNMSKITDLEFDFSDGIVDGELTDVGGNLYWYFKKNNIKIKETDVIYPTHYNGIELQNESVMKGYNFELHLNGKFLHYRAATNWHSNWKSFNDPLIEKTKIFNQIIKSI